MLIVSIPYRYGKTLYERNDLIKLQEKYKCQFLIGTVKPLYLSVAKLSILLLFFQFNSFFFIKSVDHFLFLSMKSLWMLVFAYYFFLLQQVKRSTDFFSNLCSVSFFFSYFTTVSIPSILRGISILRSTDYFEFTRNSHAVYIPQILPCLNTLRNRIYKS